MDIYNENTLLAQIKAIYYTIGERNWAFFRKGERIHGE